MKTRLKTRTLYLKFHFEGVVSSFNAFIKTFVIHQNEVVIYYNLLGVIGFLVVLQSSKVLQSVSYLNHRKKNS